jgi:hypothetical protein
MGMVRGPPDHAVTVIEGFDHPPAAGIETDVTGPPQNIACARFVERDFG